MKRNKSGTTNNDLQHLLARSTLYKILALGYRYPSDQLFKIVKSNEFLMKLEEAAAELALDPTKIENFVRALSAIGGSEKLESEYVRLFAPSDELNCSLYGTEYVQSHIFNQVQELADIMGFYRAFGLNLCIDDRERPDHVGTELEFMHILALKEAHARASGLNEQALICKDAQKKFLESHIAGWIPAFCKLVRTLTNNGFYTSLVSITVGFHEQEARELGVRVGKSSHKLPIVTQPEDFSCPLDKS